MSNLTSAPSKPSAVSPFMVVLGLTVTLLWLAAALVLGAFKWMASVMANASGSASDSQHWTLILGVMGGQTLTGLAGIPAGLVFFWRSQRRKLWVVFAILLLTGLLIQAAAYFQFLP